MIIVYNALFGNTKLIIFQLLLWVGALTKSSEAVYEECKNMLAFSYLAIPTRHEVSEKPMDL